MMNKSTELTLKKIGDFLSKMAEKSQDVYWLSSPDFQSIIYVSPAYEKIWGRTREELYKNPEKWITFLASEDVKSYHPIHAMAERIAEQGPEARYNESYRIVRPNGEVRWILDRGFPVYNDEGECCGVTGIAVDITTQKEVEIKLREAKKLAEAASAAKTEFIRNMSHDIRTPLAGIIGMANIIEHQTNVEGAQDIREAGQALLNLLNEIIETVQLESGDIKYDKRCFFVKNTINTLIDMFRPAIKEKGLQLEIYYDDNIPEILFGQELVLHRIILNLLSNAVKFTNIGSVSLEISLSQISNDKVNLKVGVIDTGIGIPEEKQKFIFDKFSRLSSSYSTNFKGTGLGLYLTKELVKKLGGDIKINSILNKGSHFICTMPFKMPTALQLKKYKPKNQEDLVVSLNDINQVGKTKSPEAQKKSAVLTPQAKKNRDKLSVLLVEDTDLPRKAAEILLTKEGYEVIAADTMQEAIEKSKQTKFDLIYMDIGLPDGTGIDVTRAIRKDPANPNVNTYIVALTAHADYEIKKECLAAGMQEVFNKPLDYKKIKLAEINMNNLFFAKRDIVFPKQSELQNVNHLPILDLEVNIKLAGGNEALAKEMLKMLVEQLPDFQEKITDAYHQQDWEMLKHHVHRLHGGLCYSGAVRLKIMTQNFEMALSKNIGDYTDFYQQLIQGIQDTRNQYKSI